MTLAQIREIAEDVINTEWKWGRLSDSASRLDEEDELFIKTFSPELAIALIDALDEAIDELDYLMDRSHTNFESALSALKSLKALKL